MEQESYYFRVGLFVTVVIVAAVIVISWFSGKQSQNGFSTYAIYFPGSVDGLTLGSAVKFKGIKVGNVRDIAFVSKDDDTIRVVADISDTVTVRKETTASLQMQGITGTSCVALETKDPKSEKLVAKDGEEYPVITASKSQLEKVFASIPDLVDQFTKLTKNAQQLLDEKNIAKINSTLDSISFSAQSIGKFLDEGKSRSLETALSELSDFLAESKTTLREVKMLARTIREDPSVILHGTQHEGVKVP